MLFSNWFSEAAGATLFEDIFRTRLISSLP